MKFRTPTCKLPVVGFLNIAGSFNSGNPWPGSRLHLGTTSHRRPLAAFPPMRKTSQDLPAHGDRHGEPHRIRSGRYLRFFLVWSGAKMRQRSLLATRFAMATDAARVLRGYSCQDLQIRLWIGRSGTFMLLLKFTCRFVGTAHNWKYFNRGTHKTWVMVGPELIKLLSSFPNRLSLLYGQSCSSCPAVSRDHGFDCLVPASSIYAMCHPAPECHP